VHSKNNKLEPAFDSNRNAKGSSWNAHVCRLYDGYRSRSDGILLAAIATSSNHTGTISGLFFGNFAIVASSTFRCWATIAGGVRVIQSDNETSAKW
jgi:hypothetical protein